MYIVVAEDRNGVEDCFAYSVDGIFGPFATRDEAEAFEKRVASIDLYGVSYSVCELEAPEKRVAFLNQLGFGKVK